MKKIFTIALALALLQACNNSSETTDAAPATNPENANGNIPDSNNSTNLNAPLPVDSSRAKDSNQH
ncbi:MAG: hypothetical protein ACJ749_03110 [Flavisolibacter sp.]